MSTNKTVMLALIPLVAGLAVINPGVAAPSIAIDETAPIISRHDIDIDATAEEVWAIQTEINAWPLWRSKVTSASFTDSLKVGSSFDWEDSGLQITSTIQEIERNRRIVWTGPAQGIFAVHVWEFTPTATGVHVHTEESWAGEGLEAQAEYLQPLLDQSLVEWLDLLKARSEATQAK
ncbi:MAG: SRPBCC family protein [Devosia sp.]